MRKSLHAAFAALLFVFAFSTGARAQQQTAAQSPPTDCPMMKQHDTSAMNERGEKGMGFSQEKTTHHFLLVKSGGVIQVEADDLHDATSRDQIRQHLAHVARMFSEGDFAVPMFVHDQTPPGAPEMKRLRAAITYKYEETRNGGRVIISSNDPRAVAAVHSFLRFQITEHKTGDPLAVGR
ncbi:MAG: hypothetical protein M3268_03440 [Acidobacteriota bacterium]|nr:hypothetical protein [Acidobacteriota bacterium]